MAEKTKIQWTDATWNIARGCSKVDSDCKFCYMYRQSLKGTRYKPDQVVRTKTVFDMPLKLKEPSKIFASSLTDFYHKDIDFYRHEAYDIIKKCPQHTFQILTKRPHRITPKNLPKDWGSGYQNVWLGTSVGSLESTHRIKELAAVPFKGIKFLSVEPLHTFIELPFDQIIGTDKIGNLINWVIIGGESGNENGKYRYRTCNLEWIYALVRQCQQWGIPVFIKQLGTFLSKQLGLKHRHGGDINEFPSNLQIRQFPV